MQGRANQTKHALPLKLCMSHAKQSQSLANTSLAHNIAALLGQHSSGYTVRNSSTSPQAACLMHCDAFNLSHNHSRMHLFLQPIDCYHVSMYKLTCLSLCMSTDFLTRSRPWMYSCMLPSHWWYVHQVRLSDMCFELALLVKSVDRVMVVGSA